MLNITQTNTYREIFQQPKMWIKEYQLISNELSNIKSFISKNFISNEYEIILAGAGTSAFIGNTLSFILPQKGIQCKAAPTTDLITHPKSFFAFDKKIVMVSFARSGNSPESLAAVQIAESMCAEVKHIIITCNKDGELAVNANPENTLLLLLPPETNDLSLAMTSSFTTMLLTCMLIADVNDFEKQLSVIKHMSEDAELALQKYESAIKEIAQREFSRAVFLGSGELKGIAEECHLKLQELTDGKVICMFDSFLGFRHGPKAVINDETLLIYLFSEDEYVQQYEKDLVEQINSNNKVVAQIAVSQRKIEIPNVNFDLEIILQKNNPYNSAYNYIPYVFIGQLLGFFKSLTFGLNPDSPSVSGNISRVVEGVKIYNNYEEVNE
ncbi:SIS domain-containing protein [Paludibacter sp. 221]|uniref:SIS domain-containing protein n=1 Tax=Paludibacter sp. 221 TaxID=2302939 RepID=UPI0013D7F4B8|nr:SIS domain-containing protein [Paludibacter sp. 221]NDV46085.1 SIS domain-containing protein [Paludibacter sp. 221]